MTCLRAALELLPPFSVPHRGGKPRSPLVGGEQVSRFDFSPDGAWLAAVVGSRARLWNMAGWKEVAALPGGAEDIKFHPQGHELFVSGSTGVYRWQFEQAAGVLRIGLPEKLLARSMGWIGLDQAGQRLAVGDLDGARLVELAKPPGRGPLLLSHRHASAVTSSPDGRWVATGGHYSGSLKVWGAHTGKPLSVPGPQAGLVAVFSPDGRWVVTLSYPEVRIWELHAPDKWRMVQQIRRAQWGSAGGAAFSPDGTILALQTAMPVVQLLEVGTWRSLVRLARKTHRLLTREPLVVDKLQLNNDLLPPGGSRS